ncbi:hypothetical protein OK016_05835 [Vibrio chagasii]|nr:hypothetical protein [Vibrio chagasii]
MQFNPPLESATLIKHYKRFPRDIKLPDGGERTIHCANTGAIRQDARLRVTLCGDTTSDGW